MSPELAPAEGLPHLIAQARQAIVDAAVACDLAALAEIAAASSTLFTYSFGGGSDPLGFWIDSESRGSAPMRALVVILRTAPTPIEHDGDRLTYGWPPADTADPLTDAHLEPLRELYTEADFAAFRELGGYIGWRAGIERDGSWWFFVAGD